MWLWGKSLTSLGFTSFGFLVCKLDEDWVRETEIVPGVSDRGGVRQGFGETGVGKPNEQEVEGDSSQWLMTAGRGSRSRGWRDRGGLWACRRGCIREETTASRHPTRGGKKLRSSSNHSCFPPTSHLPSVPAAGRTSHRTREPALKTA